MSFSVVRAASLSLLALLFSRYKQVIAAIGAPGNPAGDNVPVILGVEAGCTVLPGERIRLLSILGRGRTPIDHGEKINCLRQGERETQANGAQTA